MPWETAQQKYLRMTQIETPLWAAGRQIAGIDEVGRGPLAGPVVAACVILPGGAPVLGVDDSKKLSEQKREALYRQIIDCAIYAQTDWVDPAEIDRINILNATRLAMERAGSGAQDAVFLIDAMEGLSLPGEVFSMIKGDANSYLIAAASIVAKVERDRYMAQLALQYPEYGFERNKGYGTKEHIEAIVKYGPCPEHRRSFIKKWVSAP